MKALRFTNGYLRDRKRRPKISGTYSFWEGIPHGVCQGSILGLLLLNIDLCDLWVIMDQHDIANYAYDNTPYLSDKSEVDKSLEEESRYVLKWFSENQFQKNARKYHVFLSTEQQSRINICIAIVQIKNIKSY